MKSHLDGVSPGFGHAGTSINILCFILCYLAPQLAFVAGNPISDLNTREFSLPEDALMKQQYHHMSVKTSPTEVVKGLFGKWNSLSTIGEGASEDVNHVHRVL